MALLAHTPESIAACANTIRAGGIIGLPTETVYGLGADADNGTAVARIFAAKGRPADHPLIVHVASFDGGMSGVAHFCAQVPPFAQQLMSAFWPGPLTLILPRRADVGAAAAGGQNSIGVRCPAHPVAQALLSALRKPGAESGAVMGAVLGVAPGAVTGAGTRTVQGAATGADQRVVWGIAAPSANRFGRVSPTTAAHVYSEFEGVVSDLPILDGGPCTLGIESTIIDCTRGAPVLLRPGSINSAQVEQACGRKLLSNEELLAQMQPGPRASGTLESHYAPNARVRLMDAKALQTALDMLCTDIDQATAPLHDGVQGTRDTHGTHGSNTSSPPASPSASPATSFVPAIAVYARTALKTPARRIVLRRMPSTAAAAAHELFAVLRELDSHGVKLIWVETPPDTLEWDGVRDRLQRASA